jgi:Xaa-Pro aminopeptidase
VSTEIDLQALGLPDGGMAALAMPDPPASDRVLRTADDRPSPSQASLPALADPAADHRDRALALRRADVDEKHARLIALMDASGLDAVVLTRAEELAWFTSGGELGEDFTSPRGAVQIYVNHNCRAVVADNVQSPRVFEEELAGLGFQLKEHPWQVGPHALLADLCRNRRVAADGGMPELGLADIRPRLTAVRYPLTRLERQRLRELGRTLTLALEATCRNFEPGESEADLAGHLAHRLLREGVHPIDLRVAGDDRATRYRRATFKSAEVRTRATISAVGRRHGLCAAATRTVSLGPVDDEFRAAHALAAMVDATCIYFSRPGESVGGVFRRARRIYEKFERPDEWTLSPQGYAIGYERREWDLLPEDPRTLAHGMALRWSPSVGSARCEDTVVIDQRGYEVVTEAQRWPKLEVAVKGFPIQRPGILERGA